MPGSSEPHPEALSSDASDRLAELLRIPDYFELSKAYSGPWGWKVFWLALFTLAPLALAVKSPFKLDLSVATLVYAMYHGLGIWVFLDFAALSSAGVGYRRGDAEEKLQKLRKRHRTVRRLGWFVIGLLLITVVAKVQFTFPGVTYLSATSMPDWLLQVVGVPDQAATMRAVENAAKERDARFRIELTGTAPSGLQEAGLSEETLAALDAEAQQCVGVDTGECRVVRAVSALTKGDTDAVLSELPDGYTEQHHQVAERAVALVWYMRRTRGEAFWDRGEWSRAIAELKIAAELKDSDAVWQKLAVAHANRGNELVASGRQADALPHFRAAWAALAAHPVHAVATFEFARFGEQLSPAWFKHVKFGEPAFRPVDGPQGMSALSLSCDNASYKLLRVTSLDTSQVPILSWSWRVMAHPRNSSLAAVAEEGEQAVQVLVAFMLNDTESRILHYGWFEEGELDGIRRYEETYTSEVGGQIRLDSPHVAAEVGPASGWKDVRRNVREDYKRIYGDEPPVTMLIAVQTNCQYGGLPAKAEVSQLSFSAP